MEGKSLVRYAIKLGSAFLGNMHVAQMQVLLTASVIDDLQLKLKW